MRGRVHTPSTVYSNPMNTRKGILPPIAEFFIVVGIAFGYFIWSSLAALAATSPAPHITDTHLAFLVFYEIGVFAALWTFLRYRGWTFRRLGLKPGWRESAVGIGIAGAAYAIYLLAWTIAAQLPDDTVRQIGQTPLIAPGLSMATVLAVSLVNPLFEELFVTGYVISSLKAGRGVWLGVNASVAIRLAYHLYQGPMAVIGILPVGFVFAYWYARTGRLWPLIVAHALFDFLSLVPFVSGIGL